MKIDTSQIRRIKKDLDPKIAMAAVRGFGNSIAFRTRQESVKYLNENLILRNRYTERSLRVKRGSGTAEFGSFQEYMLTQEIGSTRSHDTAIPLLAVRGGSKKSQIRSSLRMSKLKKPVSDKGRTVQEAMAESIRLGTRIVKETGGRRPLISRVRGGSKLKSGRVSIKSARLERLYVISKRIRVRPTSWLLKSSRLAMTDAQAIFYESLEYRLKKKSK